MCSIPWFTPQNDPKGRGIGCGLRQSVRRLAAGQGVSTAMTRRLGTVKACSDADLRQFQEARLCAARGRAHKDGLSCNRGSIRDITGSCVRHDGSNDRVALLRTTEESHQVLAQWLGQRMHRRNGNTSCVGLR